MLHSPSHHFFFYNIRHYHSSQDYELVCPYYRMGCKVSCRRSTLESHLKTDCAFAQQIKDMDTASSKDIFNPDDYEVRYRAAWCIVRYWLDYRKVLYSTVQYSRVLHSAVQTAEGYVVLSCIAKVQKWIGNSSIKVYVHRCKLVWDWVILYCAVQYCAVLYCTVLYCTALYCTV